MVDKTMKPSKPSETTKTSKAKIDANRRYNEKTFDALQCRIKKDEHINQRIDDALTSRMMAVSSIITRFTVMATMKRTSRPSRKQGSTSTIFAIVG